MVGVGDALCSGTGVDVRCERVRCVAPMLPHWAVITSKTATWTNHRRDVYAVLLTIVSKAV
jgi:hypothetical protein